MSLSRFLRRSPALRQLSQTFAQAKRSRGSFEATAFEDLGVLASQRALNFLGTTSLFHSRRTYASLSPTLSSETSSEKDQQHGSKNYSHAITIKHLLDARVHMGHRVRIWNPRMAPYVYGHRNGMHVIDLDKTLIMLRRALLVTSKMAEAGCTFLWLGPRDVQKQRLMMKIGKEARVYTLGGRWVGGTLTNPIESGQAEKFGYRLPDCLFVVDTLRNAPALNEAKRLGIPTVAIVDSDCDPTAVTYPIPGNDDGAHALNLYFQLMKYAVLDGRAKAERRNPYQYQLK